MNDVERRVAKKVLSQELESYAELKKMQKQINEQVGEQSANIMNMLDGLGQRSATTTTDEGIVISVVKKQASKLVIDEARLKKALGSKVWNKVTKRVLDDQKLESAVATGDISPVTVSKCSEVHKNKAYLGLTTKVVKT